MDEEDTTPRHEEQTGEETGTDGGTDRAETAAWIEWVLDAAIDGVGPLEDAVRTCNRQLGLVGQDHEQAIRQLTTSEMRSVGLSGFISGFGGLATMPLTVPADVTWHHVKSARLAACVAHLRGYDLTTPVIRSLVALTLAGEDGRRIARNHGIELGSFEAVGRLHDFPAEALRDMQRAVGLRLLANVGMKGAINLVRLVPIVGGIATGALNMLTLRDIATAATSNFPRMQQA
ncbi:hypothetical protein [uncultured Tessaracoccus sp.]|uniref:hypothetical protein n=1 Tax=uncultured Tessaracoccus sp. TaxID=905023 RepID=UPI00260013B0|nr:hypothetical protein [uncultured Tessaracoccus sp.]